MPRRLAATLGLWLAWSPPSTVAAETGVEAPTPAPQSIARIVGTVTDETGGAMQAVTVRVFPAGATDTAYETTTDAAGAFVVEAPVGAYRVEVTAPAFQTAATTVRAVSGMEPLTFTLILEPVEERVTVEVDPDQRLQLNPLASLTAMTLSEDELLELPDDEEELVAYLMLLAGADSSGDLEEDVSGLIIDGFDQGRLPDPDEIAQIIIDPTPLRVDGSGDGPRIEIITRAGTGQWRRSTNFGFADESLDATTPGESGKPARQTRSLDVDVSGPIIADLMDIDIEASTRTQERAVESLRAVTPTDDLFEAVVRPETEHELEIAGDIALSPSRTLGVAFDYETERTENSGVGGFTLPERGIDESRDEWAFQVSERRLGADFANDVRVRVSRDSSRDVPVSAGVAIDVADAFNRGGGTRRNLDRDTRIQVEDRLRWQRRGWSFEAGLEGWYETQRSVYEDNFEGTFDFASLHDFCVATAFVGSNCEATRRIVDTASAAGVTPTYLDAAGEPVEISGAPTTFIQTSGNAELDLAELGVESFLQADRGFGERASLRLGVRYEATNHSVTFFNVSPTANVQYRLFDDTIVSLGARVSLRDFRDYEQLIRNDGSVHQRQLSISAPTFPDPFAGGTATADDNRTSLFLLDPEYRAPTTVSPQVSLTQQLRGGFRLHMSYRVSYGYWQQRTRNINAPFPGTPLSDEILALPADVRQETVDRMRPLFPNVGNVYQIESTGRSIERRLRIRLQRRGYVDVLGLGLSGTLSYSHRSAKDDNDFNNPYVPEWGLSRREHRVWSQLRMRLPQEMSAANPFVRAVALATYHDATISLSLRAEAGRPYSIRSGRDLNGDQSTRDRPPGVGRNTETAPGYANLDLTFTKYFRGADPRQAEGRDRQGRSVRFQIHARNLLNSSQIRGYSGVLSSPLFGQPIGYRQGRTVRVSVRIEV